MAILGREGVVVTVSPHLWAAWGVVCGHPELCRAGSELLLLVQPAVKEVNYGAQLLAPC